MTSDVEPEEPMTISPEEAFDVLGDETRLQILEALAEADEPMAYSELFDRIDYDDTSNFTYHLKKLVGHFVRKTEEGYTPRLAGRRVVEAIFSGVVTDTPVVERTDVDMACMYCGSQTEMAYYDEVAVIYCRECEGRIGNRGPVEEWPISDSDIVGYVSVPPAGVYDRTPAEILDSAGIWTVADVQAIVRGVCPRCSATVDSSVHVCEDHDTANEFCDQCDHQFGVSIDVRCTNCTFKTVSPYPTHALGTIDLLSFMTHHGIDPFVSDAFHLRACTEEIISIEPLRAKYTFTVDGDSLTLTVEEELTVVEATRGQVSDPV
jgi:DNA-binding transcriptional ArsR family regulator